MAEDEDEEDDEEEEDEDKFSDYESALSQLCKKLD